MEITALKNPSRKPHIYKVTNLETGQYYIGSQCSGKTVGVNYFTSSTNKVFKEGFKNYGEEKYEIIIVKEFEDPDECVHAENYMIRDHMQLKDGLCLNRMCRCGNEKIFSMVGTHHSEETRKKISISKKGIPRSEKTKQKISEAHKGIPPSEETRKKLSRALKGIPRSEKTKQKISIALQGHQGWNKGIPQSEEAKEKISRTQKGRPSPKKGTHLSEETRKKMSETHKGRPSHNKGIPRSEETRKKISETLQGRPATNQIKISIEGMVFDSLKEASKYYNVSDTAIRYWIKKNQHNAVYIK